MARGGPVDRGSARVSTSAPTTQLDVVANVDVDETTRSHMRSRSFSLLLLLTLAACDAPAVATPDAGTRPIDAAMEPDAAHEEVDAGPGRPTFSEDIYPLFIASGCTEPSCHGSPDPGISAFNAGLLLYLGDPDVALRELDRDSMTTGVRFVVPGEPEASELVRHARDTNIPAGVLDAAGLASIEAWVARGAPAGPPPTPLPADPDPGTCVLAGHGLAPLPSACLPRCTAATWDAIVACRSDPDPVACQSEVFAADPTPTVPLATADAPITLDCQECADRQTLSCQFESCPDPALAFFRCVALGGTCDAEQSAWVSCIRSSPTYAACQRERDLRCVAPPE